MMFRTIKVAALVVLPALSVNSQAQVQISTNQYPCAECAVFDNNGNDLEGFINTNKTDLLTRGMKVNQFSNNTWGYLQIKNVRIPSVSKKGDLSYNNYINTTLALYKTEDGAKATWWARQSNAPQGALVYLKTEDNNKLSINNVKYYEVTHALEAKKFALVEYANNDYNQLDFDVLVKNYILLSADAVKDPNDYKAIIDFYNEFLTKFTTIEDALLENRSFLTFITINKVKYIGYFNVVNSKLAGKLEAVTIDYEKDKETVVADIFKKLKGKSVYVYSDEIFGLDKTIIKYGHENNFKLIRRKTADTKKFNEDR